jgi:streptogramin lyase
VTKLNFAGPTITAPGRYRTLSTIRPAAVLGLLGALLLLLTAVPFAGAASGTYTLDADFDEGSAVNVVHSTPNELQLDDTVTPFGFIWVAVSTKGTVVKINTDTGEILGEYSTSPAGQPKDPSRTTVDANGNVWASNRAGNSVLRIGLQETGQCQDRNENGVIDTSTAQDDIKAWTNAGGADVDGGVSTAQDECIINYVRVSSSGTRHVSVNEDNDVWVSGTGGRVFDLIDDATGTIVRKEGSVGYGGYGGLIDGNGVIWSARSHLRWDTANPLSGANGGTWTGLGHDSYGLCIDSSGNVWETALSGNQIRKWSPSGTLLGTFSHGFDNAQGCVVDPDGDVWVAHSILGGGNSVGRLNNDGSFVGNVTVGSGPTGVAVDRVGKIWATNYSSGTVSRIDPHAGGAGAVDFTTVGLGGNPYDYSDMTGSTLTGKPGAGTWSVVHDSGATDTAWGEITWTDRLPGDSSISVRAASSTDGISFGSDEEVGEGSDLTVADGRYLKVTVAFKRSTTGQRDSPVLEDLTVRPANEPPIADAGGPYAAEEGASTSLDGSGSSDQDGDTLTYAWDLDDDDTYETAGLSPDFSAADLDDGEYSIKLKVCDPSGECDTDTAEVHVRNVAPTVNAGADQTVYRNETVNLSGSWTDPAKALDDPYAWAWTVPGDPSSGTASYGTQLERTASFASEGVYTVKLNVTDDDGATGSDDMVVKVLNREPSCASARPSESELWPPNHKFVAIDILGITDAEGDTLTIEVTGIRQDEPVNDRGDGNTAPDGKGVGTATAEVRAERSGNTHVPGDGRVYHIAYSAIDGHGGTCTGTVTVSVPHDQRGSPAVDGGALYDSTQG